MIRIFTRALIAFLLMIPLGSQALFAEPELNSKSAILIDATSQEILFEKNADLLIPPASLTKLMTMHIVLEAVDSGQVSLDDIVDLPRASWAARQPWGSSLMFIAPGQRVSLRELMLGLAVASGNDAAVAIALHLSSSIQNFALRMNEEARRLGMEHTTFIEPSGISEFNLTTAREFAFFCREYIRRHPNSLEDFHSVQVFSYPKPENLPEVFRNKPGTIVQHNRNLLLGEVDGVDGLKTGFIIESGYNLALTAQRDGTRLIAILLGGKAAASRANDGERLLNWGFDNFKTIRPEIAHLDDARVWLGKASYVPLRPARELAFTTAKERARGVHYEVRRNSEIKAPLKAGDVLGLLIFSDEEGELNSVPLLAAEAVEPGNFLKRFSDSFLLFFRKLFKMPV
ncbi:D-alanyl-D-alanine carboxypeptidase family protein [Treponema sp.]